MGTEFISKREGIKKEITTRIFYVLFQLSQKSAIVQKRLSQILRQQMRKFLKFVHDDVVYCKYYEVVYILFHTGVRISSVV